MTARYAPEIEAVLSKPTASVYPDLARVLNCGRNQAYELVRTGQVRSIRVGRAIKVPTAAIRQLLEGTPTPPSPFSLDAPGGQGPGPGSGAHRDLDQWSGSCTDAVATLLGSSGATL